MNTQKVRQLPAARAALHGTGLTRAQIDRPLVAIVYSQNEVCPGHVHLDGLADAVRRGIESEGGTGIKMNAGVGICDGIAMGHDGMKSSLPSREINRDSVVAMINSHGIFDGVVYIGGCDKNIPGYLMAAAEMKYLPGIFVTAGPMMPGCIDGKDIDIVASFSADALVALGKITEQEYSRIIEESCPGAGSCAGLFTANSMACVAEAMGLTVPGMATAHATDNKKYRLAAESGKQIMKLIRQGITIEDILTKEVFYNAFVVDMAIGASTNTVLHVPAIAEEAGYYFDLYEINRISEKTPNLLRLSPASEHRMIDFEKSGGIPVVMKRLEYLLKTKGNIQKTRTVTGFLEDRLKGIVDNNRTNVIRNLENPYSATGGITVYRGNLAPDGSVLKESGIASNVPKVFEGVARVFNDEFEATKYIKEGKLQKGNIIIIRYEGRAGGPGMREMLYPTSAITGLGMDTDVAVITDGRFSGGTAGICIGHVEPEAYNCGPIAFVENDDRIVIDMNQKKINLQVNDEILAQRRAGWHRIEKEAPTRLLQEYRKKYAGKH